MKVKELISLLKKVNGEYEAIINVRDYYAAFGREAELLSGDLSVHETPHEVVRINCSLEKDGDGGKPKIVFIG